MYETKFPQTITEQYFTDQRDCWKSEAFYISIQILNAYMYL